MYLEPNFMSKVVFHFLRKKSWQTTVSCQKIFLSRKSWQTTVLCQFLANKGLANKGTWPVYGKTCRFSCWYPLQVNVKKKSFLLKVVILIYTYRATFLIVSGSAQAKMPRTGVWILREHFETCHTPEICILWDLTKIRQIQSG